MKETGILAPVFSLPGRYGMGDFGACCFEFIDMLAENGVKIWQVLPLGTIGFGNSPYQPYSSFAGNTLYIDLENLCMDGLIAKCPDPWPETSRVDYTAVRAFKESYFREAFSNFKPNNASKAFMKQEWVRLYAVFKVLKDRNGERTWNEWSEAERDWILSREDPLPVWEEEVRYEMFLQYIFFVQWMMIKFYAAKKGVRLMGDIPFYVGQDSLDVWMNQDQFLLDEKGYPLAVAGVPPDYFSATGQRWGNPIYNWEKMKENNYKFWKERIKYTSHMFDMIRVDHFRAFDTYWKIPASCPTAMEGEWVEAPGYEFFDQMLPLIPETQIVAEDLGFMREEVYELRDHFKFPGMNVIQFTLFDEGFKCRENMITYTGTHDNEMIRAWYESLSEEDKARAKGKLLEKGCDDEDISLAFIRYALRSGTDYVIISLQDLLSLGNEARINTPGIVSADNWVFKLTSFERLKERLPVLKRMQAEA